MQYDPNTPIWLQVMTLLKTDIVTGKSAPGSKLPGGRDLALKYTINPNTAARVYQELEKAGLCETRRGLGTFVTKNGSGSCGTKWPARPPKSTWHSSLFWALPGKKPHKNCWRNNDHA